MIGSYYLSSDDKTSSQTTSDFTVKMEVFNKPTAFSIDYVQLQQTFYPLINGTNMRIDYSDGATIYTILRPSGTAVADGSWSSSQMEADLKYSLENPIGAATTLTFTVVIASDGKDKGRMTISADGSFSLLFADDSVTDTIRDILGYNHVDTSSLTTHQAQSVVQLNDDIQYIDITSRSLTEFTSSIRTSGRNVSNLLLRMPITGSFGETITYIPKVLKLFKLNPEQNIRDVDIRLVDKNGLTVDLNGGSFHMALSIYTQPQSL